jgi:photosystem I P700 chlorophyll a apoprotein A1
LHVSAPIRNLLEKRVDPKEIPLPHEFLLSSNLTAKALRVENFSIKPFFLLNWNKYSEFLTFKRGLNPATKSLWMTDMIHHHLAIAVLFLIARHLYRTNFSYRFGIKEILEAHKRPFTGRRHERIYNLLNGSFAAWNAQLRLNLAFLRSLSIIVAHHMNSMPAYPYISSSYSTQVSLFTHHMWIRGFCIVRRAAHAAIAFVQTKDQFPNNVLDRVIRHREAILSHLVWVCIFLRLHSFRIYVHNDTMSAVGRPQDMFADNAIQLQPIFAQWIQTHMDKSLILQKLRTTDFMIHHIHAFTIHVTAFILLKRFLFARSSRLIPDKANLRFRFSCDRPGRRRTCQVSAWDHIFLRLFWMYNSISIVIFHYSWKMQSDIWRITNNNWANSANTINGWLRDFLWAQSSQVIQAYGTALSRYTLMFLAAHFVWAFSLMFLFSGRGYWQELIESILWAHNKLNIMPSIQPRALSITQRRAVGVAHYLLRGIVTTWAFFNARTLSI